MAFYKDQETNSRIVALENQLNGGILDLYANSVTSAHVDLTYIGAGLYTIAETSISGVNLELNGKTYLFSQQNNKAENGLYTVVSLLPTTIKRATTMTQYSQIFNTRFLIREGLQAGNFYQSSTVEPFTLGITPIEIIDTDPALENIAAKILDLQNTKQDLITNPIADNIAIIDINGQTQNSGKKFNDDGTTNNDIWSANKIIINTNQAFLNIPSLPNVAVATTTNDTLSGLSARDGYTPVAGNFILVKNQTNLSNNGIWIASSSSWSRAKYDAVNNTYVAISTETTYSQLNIQNGIVNVNNGTANKNLQFQISISNPNATFGNSNVFVLSTTKLPVGSPSNRYIDSSIGNDTNNNGSIAFPFATISRALTGASFPCIMNLAGQTFAAPTTLTSSQSNITFQGNDTKDLGGKTIFSGQVLTSSSFTRLCLNNLSISSGALPCINFGSGDLGRHDLQDVYLVTSGTELISIPTNFTNWIYLKNVSSENSPLASLNLPNLTGTATLYILGSRSTLSIGSIGAGWTVIIFPEVAKAGVEIKGPINANATLTDFRNGIKLTSTSYFIANQTTLNTLKSDTSVLTNGFYVPQFDNPVATNGTYAKGDLLYKAVSGGVPFVIRVSRYEDLTTLSVGTSQSSTTYVKGGFGIWSAPANSSSPYTQTFNATTDWGNIVGQEYVIKILQTTHQKGISPTNINLYELNNGIYQKIIYGIEINANGDVSLSASENARFIGKISINV